MARQSTYPPHHVDPVSHDTEEEEDEDMDEEEEVDFDLAEVMNEMPLAERRKVYALRGLFDDYKAARTRMYAEIAQLQSRTHLDAQKLYDARRDIVTGAREVTEEELARLSPEELAVSEAEEKTKKGGVKVVSPGDAAAATELRDAAERPDGGIPHFWLTALSNSEVFEGRITERDRDALRALRDIRVSYLDNDPSKGVQLHFDFAPNIYFSDTTLTKTYHMEFNEDDGEVEVATIEGCEVNWTSPRNKLTVVVKQKKQRNKNTKQVRVVEREEKCDSFFHFFTAPKEPAEDGSDADRNDEDEDEDDYEQETEMDIEAGQALMEAIVPKAAYYYTGKSVEEMAQEMCKQYGIVPSGSDEDEEDDSDAEDDSEREDGSDDDGAAKPHNNKRGGANKNNNKSNAKKKDQGEAGAKGKSGAANAAAPPQQECKQQ